MRLLCQSGSSTRRRKPSRRQHRRIAGGRRISGRFGQTILNDPAASDLFEYSYDEDDDSDSMQEPELYSLVRRGNQCDWAAVARRLDRIREGIEYLRQLRNDTEGDVYESNGGTSGRESFSGIIVGRGQPLRLQFILREMRDLTWRHPYSGVTALHVAVCWHPPQAVLQSMVTLALEVPEFLFPHVEDRTNPLWVRSKHGLTPLHLACSNIGEEHVARTLLEACVPALPALGRIETSVLRAAAATGWRGKGKRDKATYALLQTKEKGSTPLHCAAQSGASLGVLRLLIEAQPHAALVRDVEGLTPLDVLCRGHERFLDRILVLIRVQDDVRRVHQGGENSPTTETSGNRSNADSVNVDIDTDLPPELDHAVGPPAHDDPSLESYRQSFLREPLREFWCKSTLLLRTMAEVLDDNRENSCTSEHCANDCRDDTNIGSGESTYSAKRYGSNELILHAVSVVAPQRGGRIPLSLLHLIAAAVPNQAQKPFPGNGRRRNGGRSGELPLHAAIRASFLSRSLSDSRFARSRPPMGSSDSREAPFGGGILGQGQDLPPREDWRQSASNVVYVPAQQVWVGGGPGSTPPPSCQYAAPVDVVEMLLDLHPGGMRVEDGARRTPLSLALRSYSRCSSVFTRGGGLLDGGDEVVRALLKKDPACLERLGLPDGVMVRALAKMATEPRPRVDHHPFHQQEEEPVSAPGDLNTVFTILQSKPDLITGAIRSMPQIRDEDERIVWSKDEILRHRPLTADQDNPVPRIRGKDPLGW